MGSMRSPTQSIRVRGSWAIFTRPELKTERVSYLCMTPSAARGVLEAILWKPAIRWRIERIKVLTEIQLASLRRNEVSTKTAIPAQDLVAKGGAFARYFADEDRAQRNTIALRNVDYVIEARLELTPAAGADDNITKFVEMFQRRLARGQHFHQPYLGCRECVADVEPCDGSEQPLPISRDLGIMLWDIDYGPKQRTPRFFAARLEGGVLEVPEDPEATLRGAQKEGAA